jgi:hypothetical protein
VGGSFYPAVVDEGRIVRVIKQGVVKPIKFGFLRILKNSFCQ